MPISLNEIDLVRSITSERFYYFVQEFWDVIIPEEPIWNWHIEYLCDELQTLAERVFLGKRKEYDLIVNISPGSTKSTIASVMFPAWVWTRMPSARTICGSYAYSLALDLSRKSRDIIKSENRIESKPGYRMCFPDILLREDQNTKGYFANTMGGMRYAVGTGGSVTGMHGHFLIVDDPLNPLEAGQLSGAELKAANDWMSETLPSRKVDKSVTPTILIMQRLHQNDPTGNRLEKMGAGDVKHICLPADCYEFDVHPEELESKYKKGLMDPIRLPRKVLRESRAELGEFGYAGQYGQSPVPRSGGMFKVDRITIDNTPNMRRFKRLCRFWDKAATADAGKYTAGVLMGLDMDDRFWVLDVYREQMESNKRERMIRQTAELDGGSVEVGIEQEPGSGGKESAENTVRSLRGFRVFVDKPTGDKADRADPFSTQVNGHNVSVARGEWNKAYLEEMRFFPFSTYLDQIDASSGAFNRIARPKRKVGAFK